MAVEARLSKHKRNSVILYAIICLGVAAWFAYDGYLNKDFITKHTVDGKPDGTLEGNKKLAPIFLVAAIGFGVYLLMIKNKKVVLGENTLEVDKKVINCDSIEKIDKTFFDTKGYFIVSYRNQAGVEQNIKISEQVYDELEPVLENLVSKIS